MLKTSCYIILFSLGGGGLTASENRQTIGFFSKLQQYSLPFEGHTWVLLFQLFHTFHVKLCTNTKILKNYL
jgi:hypothetical protein